MIKNKIGENAGIIWNTLNENKQMTFKQLKNATALPEKDILLALGWLSREHKVHIEGDKKDYTLKLIYQ